MSEQGEAPDEGIALPADPMAAFSAVMDTIAPGSIEYSTEESAPETPTPTAGDLAPAVEGEGTPAAPDPAAAPAEGDAGGGDVPAAEPATEYPAGTYEESQLTQHWADTKTGLETRQNEGLQTEAIAEVRSDYGKYFEALAKHPRELVGQTVPSASGGEGEEVLRDSADARDWQDAIRRQLSSEVEARMETKREELRPHMEVLHNTLTLLQNNADLVPMSKSFDKELATEFLTLVEPYSLKDAQGKRIGYSVPLQPLLNQVRSSLTARRAAAAAAPPAPPAPTPHQVQAAQQQRDPRGQFTASLDDPQAGVQSSAGSQSGDNEAEDFSTLFGTLGLPGLRI